MLDFSKNYFELFGLPVGFRVDGRQLSENYRTLQRQVHPDRFASGTEQERRLAMQGAIRINEAYETLRHALPRAQYLLEINGVDPDSQQGSTQDSDFLMEQMELRENLESMRGSDDPYAAVAAFLADLERRLGQLGELFSGCIEEPTPDQLSVAVELVRKMQFFSKLQADAESFEAELDEAL